MSIRAVCHVVIVLIAIWTSATYSVEADSNPANRIINGEDALPGEFPSMVSLGVQGRGHICGGSIIDEHHILTAGHCLDGDLSSGEHVVRVGCHRLSTGCPEIPVANFRIHENYAKNQNDIALIKTSQPIPINNATGLGAIKVARLSDNKFVDYKDGETLTVAGWGLTSRIGGGPSDVLRKVVVDTMSLDRCKKLPVLQVLGLMGKGVTDKNICAGSFSRNAFYGDSGGPLIEMSDAEKPKLVGIVSWSPYISNEYTCVYTRVSSFINWIKEAKTSMAN